MHLNCRWHDIRSHVGTLISTDGKVTALRTAKEGRPSGRPFLLAMAKLIKFQVSNSGDAVAVDPDAVVRIGVGLKPNTTFIKQADGSDVEVLGSFEEVLKTLNDAKGGSL